MGNFETNYNSSKHTCFMKYYYAHNSLCTALSLSNLLNSFQLNKYHAFFLSNYTAHELCSYTVNVETDKGWGETAGRICWTSHKHIGIPFLNADYYLEI